jgi:hypothetical protein
MPSEFQGPHRELLEAPDRDNCPGARPVLAYRSGDDPEYLAGLDTRARQRVRLERRGVWHGEWVELEAHQAPALSRPREALLEERWHRARPIFLPALLAADDTWPDQAQERLDLFESLQRPEGLSEFVAARPSGSGPHWRPTGPLPLYDPSRDLACLGLASAAGRSLWVKSGRLSTFDEDRSLRVRFSAGREGHDDASRDLDAHRQVQALARQLLPETDTIESTAALIDPLQAWIGGPVFLTQHIAYWNAPGGGALMHHDAFREPLEGGQRGAVYVQLAGRTAWLALSIEDLSRRVIEFVGYMQEGELAWVREELFPDRETFQWLQRMVARFGRVRKELGKPGCGRLGPLVGRGPEFTALLADAGHAFVLEPGDGIVLPNQGLECTCMHSVFCASQETTYGVSMAVREAQPAASEQDAESRVARRGQGGRRRHRRRR